MRWSKNKFLLVIEYSLLKYYLLSNWKDKHAWENSECAHIYIYIYGIYSKLI